MHPKASIPLILFNLIISQVAADSGYGATCNSIQYYNAADGGKTIFADCKYADGPDALYNVGNAINPDSCFANANGVLVGRLNGGYSGSCTGVGMSGTIMSASCKNDAGTYVSTSIDTNDWIGNYNGVMLCFDQNGEPN